VAGNFQYMAIIAALFHFASFVLILGARMNWRLVTIINAIIALVTIGAVIFDRARPRTEGSPKERPKTTSQSNSANSQSNSANNEVEERADKIRIESPDDLANASVDDLGAVPAAALTELMARATPEQLAAMALKFNDAPTDARTFGGMGIFFQAWAQLDPNAALTGAFRINDVAMRKLAARTVVNSVSPSAAEELIAFLTDHPDKDLTDESKNEFLGTLLSSWSLLEPEAASRFIDNLGNTKYGLAYRAREDIAYNWATLDPSAALAWAVTHKGGTYLADSVIRGWCRKDINAASDYVLQHLDEPAATQFASSVVNAMFDQGVDGATDWMSHMPAGAPRIEAEMTLASLWAAKDPSSAAKWLATLPASEQTNLVSTIAGNWVKTNWPEASRWIATLTGDNRDEALYVAVNRESVSRGDSLSLALSIGKEEIRNNAIESVIRRWAATDPNAAETWVKASPLPSEQRDQLRSVISEMQQQTAEVEHVIVH
jgi:hypothetical protein